MIEIHVPRHHADELRHLLNEQGIEVSSGLRKSMAGVGAPEVLYVTQLILASAANVATILIYIQSQIDKQRSDRTTPHGSADAIIADATKLISNPAVKSGSIELLLSNGRVLNLSTTSVDELKTALEGECADRNG